MNSGLVLFIVRSTKLGVCNAGTMVSLITFTTHLSNKSTIFFTHLFLGPCCQIPLSKKNRYWESQIYMYRLQMYYTTYHYQILMLQLLKSRLNLIIIWSLFSPKSKLKHLPILHVKSTNTQRQILYYSMILFAQQACDSIITMIENDVEGTWNAKPFCCIDVAITHSKAKPWVTPNI